MKSILNIKNAQFKNMLTITTLLGGLLPWSPLPAKGNHVGSKGKILVVVSSENQLQLKNGNTYDTGYYLNELTVPAKALVDEGYELEFADPKGNTPSLDQRSQNIKYFGGSQKSLDEYKKFHQSLLGLQAPKSLKEIIQSGLTQYKGIFIPGGHAPMIDLMASPELGQILTYFHNAKKPTAIICHGPVALVSTVSDPAAYQEKLMEGDLAGAQKIAGQWIYAGYNMTVFSSTEETLATKSLGGEPQFSVESALQTAGGIVSFAQQWNSHVVRDRELITGQNPYSDAELSKQFLNALK